MGGLAGGEDYELKTEKQLHGGAEFEWGGRQTTIG